MSESGRAPLDARPGAVWGRREWAAFAALGVAILLFGVIAFQLVRDTGGRTVAVAVLPDTATPTLESTQTATLAAGSATPAPPPAVPTEQAAPASATAPPTPTATVTPAPSDTPAPTDTPTAEPLATATPRPPTATPTETDTPTMTPTITPSPIPTLSFVAPQLLSPDPGQYFSGAETRIELKFSSVGSLGADEWYGLILRYRHEGNDIEIGPWIRETSFVVPGYLAGQADEPDRRYDWGVVVVKEIGSRADGTREGREISPRSEMRSFVWR